MAGDDDQPNNQFQDLVNNNNSHEYSSSSDDDDDDSFLGASDNKKKVPPILLLSSVVNTNKEEDLSIKNLKIPKSAIEEEEINNEFPRICKVCNKGFSSGKALGGHSRIHAAKKQQSLLFINNNFNTHHHLPPPPPPPGGTPTTTTSHNSTSAAHSCNPNNHISSINMNMNMMKKKKMYNNNTCSVCGKSFPSEKSLFGHMRCHPNRNWRGIQPPPHHLQQPNNNNKNSSSSTLSEAADDDADDDDAEAVPRHKRDDDDHIDSATTTTTTNRPSSSSSTTSSSVVVVDLSQSLSSSWLSTAKRGRKSTLSKSRVASSACPSGLDEQKIIPDEEDVVHNLMMLAQGHQQEITTNANSSITTNVMMPKTDSQWEQVFSESTKKKKKKMKRTIDESSSLINYPAKKLKIEEGVLVSSNNDLPIPIPIPLKTMEKGKATQADSSKDRDDLNASGDQLILQSSSCRMIHSKKKKKKRRKLKLRDLDTFDGGSDRYKCTSCNKSFPTHQALGGHRSSHNKVNKNITAAEGLLVVVDAECERSTQVGGTEEYDEVDEGAASSRLLQQQQQQGGSPYRCKVCNKTFATGQALGGHKRSHWTGPIELLAPSSCQVASSGEASHTGGGRRIPVFDLNELPPPAAMELDEEVVESAFAAQPSQHHSAGG